MLPNILSLDLETNTKSNDLADGYALEPWRVRQGLAFITSVSVYGANPDGSNEYTEQILNPSRSQLIDLLERLAGKEVYAHFATFDVAFLIASINPSRTDRIPDCIKNVKWADTSLLAKWCVNGRKASEMFFKYSLVNLINTWKHRMPYPGADEFIRMKQEGELFNDGSSDYWQKRGILDVIWTWRLAIFLKGQLPPPCRQGFRIEQSQIPKIANSWLIGMRVDSQALNKAEAETEARIKAGCAALGVSEAVLSSPTQLGRLVFGSWGFQPIGTTPTGQPKTDADTWILLAHNTGDPRLKKILETRQALTIRSKYIVAAHEALARTGDGYMYGKPQMFGADTGRLTYSNETKKGMKCAIAQHQIPRKDKLVRNYLRPPEGYRLFETDAAAQESRIMGIWSGDPEIIRIFNEHINFHSYTGAQIYGCSYEDFQAKYKAEDPQYIEWRQMGKLTNLSCNFRIGGQSLARKALTEYDTYMSEIEGRKLVNTFKRTYAGVPAYWNSILDFARQNGYSYTLAQRRYKVPIEMLTGSDAWKVEGTLISHPIQGTGGEMFYAACSQVPDALMQTSLHDGVFWIVPDTPEGVEESEFIFNRMNATPYEQLWQLDQPLPIKLEYEASRLGTSYADVK